MDYPAVGDHAVIGDGRAIALVDRRATINWMVLPEDDRIAIFASLLDAERGGCWSLAPDEPYDVERSYVTNSAVLRTTFRTADAVGEVTDCFTLHNGALLPWVELARSVRAVEGAMTLSWGLSTTGSLGEPFLEFVERRNFVHCRAEGLGLGVLAFGAASIAGTGRQVVGSVRVSQDQPDGLLALVVTTDTPLARPDQGEVEARMRRTLESWQTWSCGIDDDGPWAEPVATSARMLKLLTHHRTGAPMAAATTSIPEKPGGRRNYDYRFCWIRDASFTVDALLAIGLVEEAHRAIVAMVAMARTTCPRLTPLFTVLSAVPTGSTELALHGWRGAQPVHRGNDATDQLQLGTWGDLLDALWRYVERGNELDPATAELVTDLIDELCKRWREPDAGLWELREPDQFTVSKLGAWTALDRALRLRDGGQLSGPTRRWETEREELRSFIEEHCWSASRNSFTITAGSEDLDASCLLAGRMGFASHDQLTGTVAAVCDELADGPFVWRYTGMRAREGAFLACSFWLVDALARLGRLDEARATFAGALGAMNDVGILSEEYDPTRRELLGNLPQGLSHLSLINAAAVLEAKSRR